MKLKSLIVVLLCIVVCSSCEQPPIEAYAVLPQPQEINYVQGFVKLKDKPMVVYSNELSNEALLLAPLSRNEQLCQEPIAVVKHHFRLFDNHLPELP
jgi:hexosaminidase